MLQLRGRVNGLNSLSKFKSQHAPSASPLLPVSAFFPLVATALDLLEYRDP
jgi:hypothetical protein